MTVEVLYPIVMRVLDPLVFFSLGWIVLGAFIVLQVIATAVYQRKLNTSGIHDVDRMDNLAFERHLAAMLRERGFAVQLTPYDGDLGADLTATKDGHNWAVQAKRGAPSVGEKAVKYVLSARTYYGCDRALMITNGHFTKDARALAKANHVELWDRDRLVRELLATPMDIAPRASTIRDADAIEAAAHSR